MPGCPQPSEIESKVNPEKTKCEFVPFDSDVFDVGPLVGIYDKNTQLYWMFAPELYIQDILKICQ